MEYINVLSISDGAAALVQTEDLGTGRIRATFPEGTRYLPGVDMHPEEIMPVSGLHRPGFPAFPLHRWMLPSGHILTYTEESTEERAWIEKIWGPGRISRMLIVHETPEARAHGKAHNMRTWSQEFDFE